MDVYGFNVDHVDPSHLVVAIIIASAFQLLGTYSLVFHVSRANPGSLHVEATWTQQKF